MAILTFLAAMIVTLLSLVSGLVSSSSLYDSTSGFELLSASMGLHETAKKVDIDTLRNSLKDIGRQVMLQQFAVEEKLRTDGNSGIKQMRFSQDGPMNYYQASHTAKQVFNVHDHPDHYLTVGLGEFQAVLNGIEFRTRHNDYMLRQKSTISTEYDKTEDMVFPDVPKEVLEKSTVNEQIQEMREWFKAFQEQNYTVRDYRQYFKPIMCYMEGAWTTDKDFIEPFDSDRHFVDATSWFELQDKNRYESYSGQKTKLENLAYLPTTILDVDAETGRIEYAQWNYKILCHPIHKDIPTKYFRPLEDLSSRVPYKRSWENHLNTRSVRYTLYEDTLDHFTDYSLLDEIFYQIPGKNNLPANLTSDYLDPVEVFDVASKNQSNLDTLKVGYYHRKYMFDTEGAMGLREATRGFSDANMFTARTTQSNVAPVKLNTCERYQVPKDDGTYRWVKECSDKYFRNSYAIPLEVIYLTPLFKWNPHNVKHLESIDDVIGNPATQTGRYMKPYFGVTNKYFYQTPSAFFNGGEIEDADPADTTNTGVFVQDSNGQAQQMNPSGIYVRTPPIEGVGRVRLRYPIAPVFGEGSGVWKELNAVRQLLSDQKVFESWSNTVKFETATTTKDPPGTHFHEFTLTKDVVSSLIAGKQTIAWVHTETSHGHTHYIRITYNKDTKKFTYDRCEDNMTFKCWDQHPPEVEPLEDISRIYDDVAKSQAAEAQATA